LRDIEVIVVQDGPNEATAQALAQITDARLRVQALPHTASSARARNAGVAQARAKWVAFLDDDDEFLPRKLELQLRTAEQSRHRYPVVLCRIIGRAQSGDRVWPRRVPEPGEPLSEWLFCRRAPFYGEGLVQTSMFFTHRGLLEAVPWDNNLRCHDDVDWPLRAVSVQGAEVEFVSTAEPLAIWHLEENRPRMSLETDWRYSLSWIDGRTHLVTPRAYASFLLTWLSADMARQRRWEAFWPLLRAAVRHGQPAVMDLLVYVGHWVLPEGLKRRVAAHFAGGRPAEKREPSSSPLVDMR
jgi:glycosyltransferase involved in cell wall biosynthesis